MARFQLVKADLLLCIIPVELGPTQLPAGVSSSLGFPRDMEHALGKCPSVIVPNGVAGLAPVGVLCLRFL